MNEDTYGDNIRETSHSLYCSNIRLANWIKSHLKDKFYNSDYFNVCMSPELQQFYTIVFIGRIRVFKKLLTTSFSVFSFRCVCSNHFPIVVLKTGYLCME